MACRIRLIVLVYRCTLDVLDGYIIAPPIVHKQTNTTGSEFFSGINSSTTIIYYVIYKYYMLFHTIKTFVPKINNTNIEKVEEFNFLGLTLDTHLNWKMHSEIISNKCSRISGILNNLKCILPERIKMLLYNTLVLPHINYCLMTWGYYGQIMYKIQKRAIRTITLSKYNDHKAPLFKKLKLLTLKDIIVLQELKFYFKFVHKILPSYLQQWQLTTNTDIHTYTTHANKTNFTLLVLNIYICKAMPETQLAQNIKQYPDNCEG